MDEELVLTPGGYRPKSLTHLIGSGHSVRTHEGRVLEFDRHDTLVADLGATAVPLDQLPPNPATAPDGAAPVPGIGHGWIAFGYWNNHSGQPISNLRTTFVVPPPPATSSGQTIFLFPALVYPYADVAILQPVLQWGRSSAGGGPYWSIASWLVFSHAIHTKLIPVNEGQTLVGTIRLTGRPSGLFTYSCAFEGLPETELFVGRHEPFPQCTETLEAYSLQLCSDYPHTEKTAMTDIAIECGSASPEIAWTPVHRIQDCGQHCIIVSNSATAGEVDIFYKGRIPVDCPTLLTDIANLSTQGVRVPDWEAAQFEKQLQTCYLENQITKAQLDTALSELKAAGPPIGALPQ